MSEETHPMVGTWTVTNPTHGAAVLFDSESTFVVSIEEGPSGGARYAISTQKGGEVTEHDWQVEFVNGDARMVAGTLKRVVAGEDEFFGFAIAVATFLEGGSIRSVVRGLVFTQSSSPMGDDEPGTWEAEDFGGGNQNS